MTPSKQALDDDVKFEVHCERIDQSVLFELAVQREPDVTDVLQHRAERFRGVLDVQVGIGQTLLHHSSDPPLAAPHEGLAHLESRASQFWRQQADLLHQSDHRGVRPLSGNEPLHRATHAGVEVRWSES